jgi:ribosomal-protein-alanine N-acetyltransferase
MAARHVSIPEIGPARPADAPRIAAISRRFIEHDLDWRWRASAISRHIRDDNSCVVVARAGGSVIGFALMSFQFEESNAHLLLLAVLPAHRREGLATRLTIWLEAISRRGGIRRIHLEVRERAHPARAFYARMGFRESARLPGYYQGREAGLKLEKRLARGPLSSG